ncbi:hypothetical protein [Marinoscillum sp.]|uniref:hypothetical protein n=1 Tax=Marinoscillum sp. TaxID=2024838 RepID=UPI003BAA5FB2
MKEMQQQIDGIKQVDVQLEHPPVKVESAKPFDLNKVNLSSSARENTPSAKKKELSFLLKLYNIL